MTAPCKHLDVDVDGYEENGEPRGWVCRGCGVRFGPREPGTLRVLSVWLEQVTEAQERSGLCSLRVTTERGMFRRDVYLHHALGQGRQLAGMLGVRLVVHHALHEVLSCDVRGEPDLHDEEGGHRP